MVTVIYSGSFNPIHTGHAMLASWMSQYRPEVQEVWLTVTPRNPLKQKPDDVADLHRVNMASLVADSLPGVKVSTFEFGLPQPSYTYHTLKALADEYPNRKFKILIGSDNWLIFNKWKDHERIISEFGVYIYPRPGFEIDPDTLPEQAIYLPDAPQAEISSTFIRDGIANGRDMNYFLPQAVYDYVCKHHIYQIP